MEDHSLRVSRAADETVDYIFMVLSQLTQAQWEEELARRVDFYTTVADPETSTIKMNGYKFLTQHYSRIASRYIRTRLKDLPKRDQEFLKPMPGRYDAVAGFIIPKSLQAFTVELPSNWKDLI